MKRLTLAALVFALAAGLLPAFAGCEDREPQERTINLELNAGEVVGGEQTWQVNQDDEVTLVVRSDEPVNFHLHGYDFEEDVEPGHPAEFTFTANATGSFPITVHLAAPGMQVEGGGKDHAATVEAPKGMSVSVEATPDSVSGMNVRLTTTEFAFTPAEVGGEHVPGHGHAHIYVDGVKVARLYGPDFHLGGIEPGERELRVTLNANTHEEYALGHETVEHTITVTVPGAADDGGHKHGGGDAVEKELGRFEVFP